MSDGGHRAGWRDQDVDLAECAQQALAVGVEPRQQRRGAGFRAPAGPTHQLHDTTLAAIRKLKDGNGRYIWSPGEAGLPSRILDFPYVVNNDMAQLTSGVNSAVAAIGDFSRYFVRDVTTPWIVRADELFISSGLVGYKVFSRHDGNLADTAAVKLLKLAAA